MRRDWPSGMADKEVNRDRPEARKQQRAHTTGGPLSPSARERLRDVRRRFAAKAMSGSDALEEVAPLVAAKWCFTPAEQRVLTEEIRADAGKGQDRDHVKAILALASSILPYQRCACGSGLDVASCCHVRATATRPKKVELTTSGSKTHVELRRCYARATRDCRKPLSREHYLSACVIKELFPTGQNAGLAVSGIPGVGNAKLPTKALVARVLCRRHNEALSSLDAVGCEFVRVLKEVAVAAHERRLDRLVLRRSFYGPDVERWLLKVLLGMLASGAARYRGQRVPRTIPRLDLVETLLGQRSLPPLTGLVFVPPHNFDLPPPTSASVAFTPFAWGGQPAALALRTWGMSLLLAVRPPTAGPDAPRLANGFYRPQQIWILDARDVRIDLDWDSPWDGPIAMLRTRMVESR